MRQMQWMVLAAALVISPAAMGDEVLFKNGDRISGVVERIGDDKLKITSDIYGEIVVDATHVVAVTTTQPATTTAATTMAATPATAPTTVATTQAAPTEPGKRPGNLAAALAEEWTGSLRLAANAARGNSQSEALNIAFDAKTRRDPKSKDDRTSFAAAYNLGRQRDSDGVYTTSADNWFANIKYDHFFTHRWYGYTLLRYDHDRLADLEYRLSPGVGTGYQWVERPDFNFLTEAGISYVFEEYTTGGNEDRVALRLAYKLDKKLNDNVSVFHHLEWLPAINDPSDYNLNADAGIRAKLTKAWFSEFKVQWQHDSTPAPGALKNDLRFLLGVGLTF